MKWPFVKREKFDALVRRVEALEKAAYRETYSEYGVSLIPASQMIEAVLEHFDLRPSWRTGEPSRWVLSKKNEGAFCWTTSPAKKKGGK